MDGIIVINKPKGYTSHDVVAKVKKILNVKKVGHTGTLDPNATGVLPLLLNNGTKLSKYLIEHDKEYIATIKLGIKTDTADSEGNVIEEKAVGDLLNVQEVLNTFLGKQTQMPPMYSAIKVKGKKLYEYARSGQTIRIEPRNIEIYSIELLNISKETNEITYRVQCSKGTYIRSLCEDIAQKLGTVGYMKELNRIKVGRFKIEDAITIEELESQKDNSDFVNSKIITLEKLFENYEKIELTEKELAKFLNGVKIDVKNSDGIYNVYSSNKYIGLAIVKEKTAKRDLIISDANMDGDFDTKF